MKIHFENIKHLKTTTMPGVVGAVGMIKKVTDTLAISPYKKYKNCPLWKFSSEDCIINVIGKVTPKSMDGT